VEVRVVAAANTDLPALAETGRFRPDLLDRLAFDVLTVPPLRAREGDVALLAEHFAIAMAKELGRPFFAGFTDNALATLTRHGWPGNVRELKNVVERAVYRCEPIDQPIAQVQLDPFDSPFRPGAHTAEPGAAPAATAPLPASPPVSTKRAFLLQVADFERALLTRALADHRYNRRRAAAALGLTYDQLRGYLKKYRLGESEEKHP
jgi:psp operon transcriptional activator